MSVKRAKQPSKSRPSRGRADLKRLRQMTEGQIEGTSPPELADLPDDFWADAEVVAIPAKEASARRRDSDGLSWVREGGPRYQSRMNAVLRSYVRSMKRNPVEPRSHSRIRDRSDRGSS